MGSVKAVLFRLRVTLRRRWLPAVLAAVVVAVISGAVLTLAAGARRAAHAPAAVPDAIGGGPDAAITQSGAPPRTAEVAALPGVRAVEAMSFAFATVTDPARPDDDALVFIGSRRGASRLVAGRFADPGQPHEFVADRRFVNEHHAHLGDRFPVRSWSAEQLAAGEAFVANPAGPSFDGVLVGVLQSPEALQNPQSFVIFSPGLLDAGLG